MQTRSINELQKGIHRSGDKPLRLVFDDFSTVIPENFMLSFDEDEGIGSSNYFVAMYDNGEQDFDDRYECEGYSIAFNLPSEHGFKGNLLDSDFQAWLREKIEFKNALAAQFMDWFDGSTCSYRSESELTLVYTVALEGDQGQQYYAYIVTADNMYPFTFTHMVADPHKKRTELHAFLDSIRVGADLEKDKKEAMRASSKASDSSKSEFSESEPESEAMIYTFLPEFSYSNQVTFVDTEAYGHHWSTNDEGKKNLRIVSGEEIDDEGNKNHRFNYFAQTITPETRDEAIAQESISLFDSRLANMEDDQGFFLLEDEPRAVFDSVVTQTQMFHMTIKMILMRIWIEVKPDELFMLALLARPMIDADSDLTLELCDNVLALARTVRINGQALKLDKLTAGQLVEKLKLDEDRESTFDMSETLKDTVVEVDGHSVSLDYVDDEYRITVDGLTPVIPDLDHCCEHFLNKGAYQSQREEMLGRGIIMMTNPSNKDYEFIPLGDEDDWEDEDWEDDDDEESLARRALLKRVRKADKGGKTYWLEEEALEMAGVFRVDEDTFDPSNDRENDIHKGWLSDAYLFTLLRSFAWTLAEYCEKAGIQLKDVRIEQLYNLASFVENRKFLNYKENSHFAGLCNGNDIHNYYIPDSVSDEDRKNIVGEADENFIALLQRYNRPVPLASGVLSLDSLREDLLVLHPVMRKLHDFFSFARDPSEALEGVLEDVLYAWCAFAVGAAQPFYLEDGPMSTGVGRLTGPVRAKKIDPAHKEEFEALRNTLSQLFGQDKDEVACALDTEDEDRAPDESGSKQDDPTPYQTKKEGKVKPKTDYRFKSPFQADEYWMRDFGPYLSSADEIAFFRGTFAFTGPKIGNLEGHKIAENVIARGGELVKSVTANTHYLIVNPKPGGDAKTKKAVDLIRKGKKVEIILFEDFMRHLAANPLPGNKYVLKPLPKRPTPEEWGAVTVPSEDMEVEDGVLKKYHGSGKSIIFPEGIHEFFRASFLENEEKLLKIESLIIPEGVESVSNTFMNLKNLVRIMFPKSLRVLNGHLFSWSHNELVSVFFHRDSSLEILEADTFRYCRKLSNIVLPRKLGKIGIGAFMGCENLVELTLPDGTEEMRGYVFSGCKSLMYIKLPKGIRNIQDTIFENCQKLAHVSIPATVERIGKGLFRDVDKSQLTLYVEPGSYAEVFALENVLYYEYTEY